MTVLIVTTVHRNGQKSLNLLRMHYHFWRTCKPSTSYCFPHRMCFRGRALSLSPWCLLDNYCLPGCIMTPLPTEHESSGEPKALDATATTWMLLLLKHYVTNLQLTEEPTYGNENWSYDIKSLRLLLTSIHGTDGAVGCQTTDGRGIYWGNLAFINISRRKMTNISSNVLSSKCVLSLRIFPSIRPSQLLETNM